MRRYGYIMETRIRLNSESGGLRGRIIGGRNIRIIDPGHGPAGRDFVVALREDEGAWVTMEQSMVRTDYAVRSHCRYTPSSGWKIVTETVTIFE